MKDIPSNIPPGEEKVYERSVGGIVSGAMWLNRGRSFPPVGGPEYSRRKELLDSLQKGVDKMNDKNDKV